MRRRLMDGRSACDWDEHVRLGCRSGGCSCHWLEQCAPRYELVVMYNRSSTFVDVGYCAPSYLEPILTTVLLPAVFLLFLVLIRYVLSILDSRGSAKKLQASTSAAVFSANVSALCQTSKVKGKLPAATTGQ